MATLLPSPVPFAMPPLRSLPSRLRDRFGRAITDLRVSVTDRCNYRCVYCRTGEHGSANGELPIADYAAMVRLMVELGIEKVRLTGGEPLLRAGLLDLIRDLSTIRTAFDACDDPTGEGRPLDLALTTNGHLLAGMARDLKRAGLNRVTVSMDAVDAATSERITRVPRALGRVLDGIHAAQDAGLAPVKVNCVLMRGFNDDQIEAFGDFARREGVILRFIEFMPLGEDRHMGAGDGRARSRDPRTPAARHASGPAACECAERDRAAVRLRRRHWRNRHHCACLAPVLRALLAHPAHQRRQAAHLPVLAGRS